MIEGIFHSEAPQEHWAHLNAKGKTVLDLGCGFWTDEERRAGNGTANYFISQNPEKYVGIDCNAQDIQSLATQFNGHAFIESRIENKDQILNLICQHNPTLVKCDIEGAESALFQLNDCLTIEEIGIETHNGSDGACLAWMLRVGLIPWRIDAASFCPEIKVIYGKC